MCQTCFIEHSPWHAPGFPHDNIIKICETFYSEDYVAEQKNLLFTAIGKKPQTRHPGHNVSKTKDLEDILSEIKSREQSNGFLPIFATTQL